MKLRKFSRSGVAVLMVFLFSVVLSGMVIAYLDLIGILSKTTSYKINRYRTISIAEAGINRIAWYLENTAPNSTTNGSWRGTVSENVSITETTLTRTYTYNAAASDLPLEGPVITASSVAGANVASSAMDGNINTYWRSSGVAGTKTLTFNLAINGDYTIYLSRTRMLLGAGTATQFPRNYTWAVSTNGTTWTTVVTKTGNALTDVTDTFALRQANYLRLSVTLTPGGASSAVNIAEVEVFGAVVPASGTSSNALDNNLTTSWSASGVLLSPQSFTVTFPSGSNYSINKIRMRSAAAQSSQFPTTYTLDVYDNVNAIWIIDVAYTQTGSVPDVTATLDTLQTNITQLRINVTVVQGGGDQVSIGEIDVPAACISSNSAVTYPGTRSISYFAAQNVIVNGTAPPSVSGQPKAIFGAESGQ